MIESVGVAKLSPGAFRSAIVQRRKGPGNATDAQVIRTVLQELSMRDRFRGDTDEKECCIGGMANLVNILGRSYRDALRRNLDVSK